MNPELRTDFENIPDGAQLVLHPADANMIHRQPVHATHLKGGFYCVGSNPLQIGPDYRISDVAAFFRGYELQMVTA